MRRVVCRFEDESDFLSQFNLNRRTGELQFLAEFPLETGEEIRVTTLVSRLREQCDLRMQVVDARTLALDEGDESRVFRYRARVLAEDAVWLEMFAKKMTTLFRVESAAA